MKKYICISLLASLHGMNCFSQEISGFLTFNNIQLNPAYAGQDGRHAFNLAEDISTEFFKSKNKRIGGAPKTYEFAYAADIRKIKSGAGLFASSYELGIEKRYKIGAIYDYNFKISENSNLRLGIQFNMLFVKVNLSGFFLFDPDDPNIHADQTVTKFNISPGVWYKLKEFNIGFTAANLLNDKWQTRDFCIMTYYNFKAGEHVKITPSLRGNLYEDGFGTKTYEYFQLHAEFARTLIVGGGVNFVQQLNMPRNGVSFNLGVKPAKPVLIMLGYSESNFYFFTSRTVSALIKVDIK